MIHPGLFDLFRTVWYAESLEACPRIADWKRVLESIELPIMEVSPQVLNIGVLDLSNGNQAQPSCTIEIKNAGSGVLQGQIVTKFPWLSVEPQEFSCPSGIVSEHKVKLGVNAPRTKNQNSYAIDSAITVLTEQDNRSLSATYSIVQPRLAVGSWLWILVSMLALGVVMICCMGSVLYAYSNDYIYFTTPKVSNIRMATSTTGTVIANSYSPTDNFYVFADLSGIKVGSVVEARWYAVNANGVDPNSRINTSDYHYEAGVDYVYFMLSTSDGSNWPAGIYKVELYLDGTKVGEKSFAVR